MKHLILASLIFVPLTACAQQPQEPIASIPATQLEQACDFPDWVDKPLNRSLIENLKRPTRIIAENSAVTMDYRSDRLNVEHKKDIVTRVWCG